MNRFILLMAFLFLCSSLSAQDDEGFTRKGKFIIETGGASLLSGFGSSTGGSVIVSDGNSLTQIGIEIGKFISEDLAIKVKAGTLTGIGTTLSNFGVAAKYYIGGVAPLDVDLGIVTGEGSSSFLTGAHLGYAITLANNIYFEPKAGILYSEESTVLSGKFSFALIF